MWGFGETIFNATDPSKAEAELLDALGKLTGAERGAAEYGTVAMNFTLNAGDLLESRVNFVQDEDNPSSRWTPVEDYEATSTGVQTSVLFRSENKGPFTAGAGKLTVISTPVGGWASPTNPFDATVGRNVAEDPEYRVAREAQIGNAAGATVLGIASALAKVVEPFGGTVLPFENATGETDGNGLPPNSFEMVVWDGSPGGTNVQADTIARTIWSKKGSGARPFGLLTGTATDANGDEQPVSFSRSQVLAVYLEFDLEVGDDFDPDAFALAAATEANRVFTGGKSVLRSRLISIAWQQPGIENVLAVRLGTTPSPASTADIPVTTRQIARFDSTRVEVNT